MTTCLPPVHTIAQPVPTIHPSFSGMPRHKASLAASYASYVVRVHTRHGIKTLSFDVLAELFTFTAKKAAEDLGISSRTLIRVCRSLGIRRWPYLGFRSEKNVERIRQEAMENLRRKLEKEGDAMPTTIPHPNASSLRGASAKRLLQVKLPQMTLPALSEAASRKVSRARPSSWCSSPTLPGAALVISDEDERMSEGDDSDWAVASTGAPAPSFSPSRTTVVPLMTPPSTVHGFNLDLQRVSPSKGTTSGYSTINPSYLKSTSWTTQTTSHQSGEQASQIMPSLNLLVNASILTSFKQDISTQSSQDNTSTDQAQNPFRHPRTMSMQDILTLHQ